MGGGSGRATLVDLGAATKFGVAVRECLPPAVALGCYITVSKPEYDLIGLAVTLWLALDNDLPPDGTSPASFAELAEAEAGVEVGGGGGGGEGEGEGESGRTTKSKVLLAPCVHVFDAAFLPTNDFPAKRVPTSETR